MPPPSSNAHLPPSQPAARQRPKSPERVLAEADAQWLYTEEELARSPSVQDGMAHEKEKEIRSKGVGFIRQVGIMLKLPELTLSTAAIFLNRFLMRRTLVDHPGQKALHHYVRFLFFYSSLPLLFPYYFSPVSPILLPSTYPHPRHSEPRHFSSLPRSRSLAVR